MIPHEASTKVYKPIGVVFELRIFKHGGTLYARGCGLELLLHATVTMRRIVQVSIQETENGMVRRI